MGLIPGGGFIQLAALLTPYTTDVAFYVNQSTGNDGNPGTQTSPFQTIERAFLELERGWEQAAYVRIQGQYTIPTQAGNTLRIYWFVPSPKHNKGQPLIIEGDGMSTIAGPFAATGGTTGSLATTPATFATITQAAVLVSGVHSGLVVEFATGPLAGQRVNIADNDAAVFYLAPTLTAAPTVETFNLKQPTASLEWNGAIDLRVSCNGPFLFRNLRMGSSTQSPVLVAMPGTTILLSGVQTFSVNGGDFAFQNSESSNILSGFVWSTFFNPSLVTCDRGAAVTTCLGNTTRPNALGAARTRISVGFVNSTQSHAGGVFPAWQTAVNVGSLSTATSRFLGEAGAVTRFGVPGASDFAIGGGNFSHSTCILQQRLSVGTSFNVTSPFFYVPGGNLAITRCDWRFSIGAVNFVPVEISKGGTASITAFTSPGNLHTVVGVSPCVVVSKGAQAAIGAGNTATTASGDILNGGLLVAQTYAASVAAPITDIAAAVPQLTATYPQ